MIIKRTSRFKTQYKKQTNKVKKQFHQRVDLLLSDPRNKKLRVHRLSGKHKGSWIFDVSSDVRVIYDRTNENSVKLLLFQEIGSHSELY